MPCICNFEGIYIYMYYNDHMPPHFHALYNEHEAIILLDTLTVEKGILPGSKLKLVRKWAELHAEELSNDWELARQMVMLKQIAPL
jgi:hypothetical protein